MEFVWLAGQFMSPDMAWGFVFGCVVTGCAWTLQSLLGRPRER